MSSAAQPRPTPAWALDFPEPKATPPKISQEELAELVRTKSAGVDYLVVDVRRSDIEVSLPAASKSASVADHRIPHPASRIPHHIHARTLTNYHPAPIPTRPHAAPRCPRPSSKARSTSPPKHSTRPSRRSSTSSPRSPPSSSTARARSAAARAARAGTPTRSRPAPRRARSCSTAASRRGLRAGRATLT